MSVPSSPATALVVASLYNRMQTITAALEDVGWTIKAYQQVGEALEALRSESFEAVFCDEYLRGASPTGFLAWSRRLVPDTPFHLFCVDEKPKNFGGRNRPDSLLAFPPVAATVPLPERKHDPKPVRESARDLPLQGNTSITPLGDLLEMMGVASQSATITLEGGRSGSIHIEQGTLMHAVHHHSGNQGIRALSELLELSSVDFEVRPFSPPRRKTIHLPTTSAITEAARLHDERRRDQTLVQSVQQGCPSCDSVAIGYPLAQTPSFAVGDGDEVFAVAKGLLEQNRELLGRITHLSLENDRHGYALLVFGEGNLLAGRVPPGKSLVLLAAMAKAVRGR